MAYEQPEYRIINKIDNIEVREYQSFIVAETVVESSFEQAGNDGHRLLAEFISGNNIKQESIAMTAPVSQERAEIQGEKIEMAVPVNQESAANGKYRISFVMPSRYTLETLPTPQDKRILLRNVPAKKVVVIKYSGTWSMENYAENEAKLREFIKQHNYSVKGEPIWARYDPPFMPWFLRRNEIMIEVQ
jgi:effector-binding domain-containing protein